MVWLQRSLLSPSDINYCLAAGQQPVYRTSDKSLAPAEPLSPSDINYCLAAGQQPVYRTSDKNSLAPAEPPFTK